MQEVQADIMVAAVILLVEGVPVRVMVKMDQTAVAAEHGMETRKDQAAVLAYKDKEQTVLGEQVLPQMEEQALGVLIKTLAVGAVMDTILVA